MAYRNNIKNNGWKQGIILKADHVLLKKDVHYDIDNDCFLLIITQDCDLLNESEPYFEVLCLHPLQDSPNNEYAFGKNGRRIELSIDISNGETAHWYCKPYERHLLPSSLLTTLKGVKKYEPQEKIVKMILNWITLRYTRLAFPDTFVGRLKKPTNNLKKLVKCFSRLNPYVCNIYIAMDSFEELDENRNYNIKILLPMRPNQFDDSEAHKICQEQKNILEDLLNKCEGINVDEIYIASTADITIEEIMEYRNWDYSYLSSREPNNESSPIVEPKR